MKGDVSRVSVDTQVGSWPASQLSQLARDLHGGRRALDTGARCAHRARGENAWDGGAVTVCLRVCRDECGKGWVIERVHGRGGARVEEPGESGSRWTY
jgi:hypothetical protein